MPNTLNYSGMEAPAADGTQTNIAPALLALTGASVFPVPQGAVASYRFASAFTPPNGAGQVVDLWMIGGLNNPRQWQMVTYTNTAGVLSAPQTLILNDVSPAGSSGTTIGTAPALLALTGGIQGTYPAGTPWYRFATAFTPANGQTVADLVMVGGPGGSERWYVVTYTNTAGVLS